MKLDFKSVIRFTLSEIFSFLHVRPLLPIGGRSKDQIVEDGCVGGDPDAAAHHDRHLELVPVLVAAAEGSLNANLEQTIFFSMKLKTYFMNAAEFLSI
jgi:hypothetical protein